MTHQIKKLKNESKSNDLVKKLEAEKQDLKQQLHIMVDSTKNLCNSSELDKLKIKILELEESNGNFEKKNSENLNHLHQLEQLNKELQQYVSNFDEINNKYNSLNTEYSSLQ